MIIYSIKKISLSCKPFFKDNPNTRNDFTNVNTNQKKSTEVGSWYIEFAVYMMTFSICLGLKVEGAAVSRVHLLSSLLIFWQASRELVQAVNQEDACKHIDNK